MKDSDHEQKILSIVKEMKTAINNYQTVEYQKLGIDLHASLQEYFLNPKDSAA